MRSPRPPDHADAHRAYEDVCHEHLKHRTEAVRENSSEMFCSVCLPLSYEKPPNSQISGDRGHPGQRRAGGTGGPRRHRSRCVDWCARYRAQRLHHRARGDRGGRRGGHRRRRAVLDRRGHARQTSTLPVRAGYVERLLASGGGTGICHCCPASAIIPMSTGSWPVSRPLQDPASSGASQKLERTSLPAQRLSERN